MSASAARAASSARACASQPPIAVCVLALSLFSCRHRAGQVAGIEQRAGLGDHPRGGRADQHMRAGADGDKILQPRQHMRPGAAFRVAGDARRLRGACGGGEPKPQCRFRRRRGGIANMLKAGGALAMVPSGWPASSAMRAVANWFSSVMRWVSLVRSVVLLCSVVRAP